MITLNVQHALIFLLAAGITGGGIGWTLGKNKAYREWMFCLKHAFGRIGQLDYFVHVMDEGRKAAERGDFRLKK